jgi:capsular polysaccharide transport system permease protein
VVEFTQPRQLHPAGGQVGEEAPAGSRTATFIRKVIGAVNLWFWAIVGVPTLVAGVFYFGIAADLYLSEAKFTVHGPVRAPTSAVSAALESTGLARAADDAFAVQEFIMSRDAVRKLEQHEELRTILNRPEGDFVTRFPGVFRRTDFEALYERYKHFVAVEIDTTTGVCTLHVKAYRPDDARLLATTLMAYAEQLVNDMNERARHDALVAFRHEVEITQQRIQSIQAELTAYRLKERMIDPKTASTGPLELLGQLNSAEANAKGQLAELLKNSPNSPQIPLVKTRIASLEKLIADERAKITGDNNSVVTALTEYERLATDRELAEKTLASAFISLEAARLEAQRQQIFLETIAQPNLADYPLYPKSLASFALVFGVCLIAYGIAGLLIASVREHAAA